MSEIDNIEEGPVWQDDNSVTRCFICDSNYHIFNRRHHCRKCGRVVCGSCSQQPVKYFPNTVVVLNGSGDRHIATAHERFRTCDECVEEIRMIRRALFAFDTGRTAGYFGDDGGSTSTTSTPENTTPQNEETTENNSVVKHVANTRTRLLRTSSSHSDVVPNSSRRHRSRSNHDDDSDDNLCPVCAVDLLKLYIDRNKTHIENISNSDFEEFKAGHISDCLVAYDFSTSAQRFSPSKKSPSANKMLVYNIPPIPKPIFENIPDNADRSDEPVENQDDQVQQVGSVQSNQTIPQSSEKKEDIVENECVICLEDLKPGDKVGRLECLCVFHYKCIKDWFNKKGYGECPVHFIHK